MLGKKASLADMMNETTTQKTVTYERVLGKKEQDTVPVTPFKVTIEAKTGNKFAFDCTVDGRQALSYAQLIRKGRCCEIDGFRLVPTQKPQGAAVRLHCTGNKKILAGIIFLEQVQTVRFHSKRQAKKRRIHLKCHNGSIKVRP